jgi:hypothetical protein
MHVKAQLATRLLLAGMFAVTLALAGCGGSSNSGSTASGATANDAGATATATSTSTTSSSTTTAGTATLSWAAPTENIDGTPVTGLAGYRVYYGTSADALTQSIEVPGPATTTYVVSDLGPGTYYFAVAAYNSDGIEGAQSSVASKTI